MLIHITDVVATTLDIKEQQEINTCGVKDTYSWYVRRKLYTNMDKSLPLRPSIYSAVSCDGTRHIGFSLSSLMDFDKRSIKRVKHSMFLPCLDTLVVNERCHESLHDGTDLHAFSLF